MAAAAVFKSTAQVTAHFAPVPWLSPAVGLLCGIIDMCARVSSNKNAFAQLQERCYDLLLVLQNHADEMGSDRMKEAVTSVEKTLDCIHKRIQVWAAKNRVELILLQLELSADIQECHEDITKCLQKFQFTSHLEIHKWQAEFENNRTADSAEVIKYLSDIKNTEEIVVETQKQHGDILHSLMDLLQKSLPGNAVGEERGLEKNLYYLQKSSGSLLPHSHLERGEVRRSGLWPVDGSSSMYDIWEGFYLNEEKVAIKVIRAAQCSPKTLSRFKREAAIWEDVWKLDRGKHILPFYGFCQNDGPYPYVVSPWQPNGTAPEYLNKYPDADHLAMIRGVAEGLRILHTMQPPVVHGNLKGSSIVIDSSGNPLLADFGFSKITEDITGVPFTMSTGISDSYRWLAPELIIDQGVLSTACDIYAFGMTVLELLTHKHPWEDVKRSTTVVIKVSQGQLPSRPRDAVVVERGLDGVVWGLLEKCWVTDSKERATIQQVLQELH
ncbi:hypothetical protein SERLA73DRAFT_177238 [Serpula lacrymans var. lacrymans S7.3]|uniref:Protein kinase domain-containing protein n=2 Tax=Serpula lacrymans var. lacrymans TaxID=341189 RepID=F8PNN1_SERL3|nr:hypothetical protein SERLA73DRAFT_177238 [Serpula lacrymans var. lacrymans S7.3]